MVGVSCVVVDGFFDGESIDEEGESPTSVTAGDASVSDHADSLGGVASTSVGVGETNTETAGLAGVTSRFGRGGEGATEGKVEGWTTWFAGSPYSIMVAESAPR